MLKGMGAKLENDSERIYKYSSTKRSFKTIKLTVPTDPSSAFFLCCCTITPKFKSF